MSDVPLKTNPEGHKVVTEELVKEALLKDKGPDAKFKTFEVIDFCSKGDNYACFVTSVKVTFILGAEEKTVTYITKINPGGQQGIVEKCTATMFSKESKFYKFLVPALNEVVQKLGLPSLKFPSCYAISSEHKREIIFFNDKRKMAFKMADRLVGLDDDHTILVVTELARLHAASALLKDNLGEEKFLGKYDFLQDYFTGCEISTDVFANGFTGHLETGSKIASKVPGYEAVSAALASMAPSCFKILKKVTDEGDSKFRVVNHGDCWVNNLLFRYDDGKVVDVCLLDLQICRHASIVLDLQYFLFTSLDGDARKKGLKSYLAAYYAAFKEVFDAAAKPMQFTLEELHKEYVDKLVFGMIMGFMVTPMVAMQHADAPDFSEATGDNLEQKMEDFRQQMVAMVDTNPFFKSRLVDMFDEMLEHGVFKVL